MRRGAEINNIENEERNLISKDRERERERMWKEKEKRKLKKIVKLKVKERVKMWKEKEYKGSKIMKRNLEERGRELSENVMKCFKVDGVRMKV